jgi:hypothetical protein
MSARAIDLLKAVKVFTNTGNFLDQGSQKDYVLRYLTLSNNIPSDRRFLQRIQTWFIGRYGAVCRIAETMAVTVLQPASLSSSFTPKILHVIESSPVFSCA